MDEDEFRELIGYLWSLGTEEGQRAGDILLEHRDMKRDAERGQGQDRSSHVVEIAALRAEMRNLSIRHNRLVESVTDDRVDNRRKFNELLDLMRTFGRGGRRRKLGSAADTVSNRPWWS